MANVVMSNAACRFGRYDVAAEVASPRFAGGSTVYIAIARPTKNIDPTVSSSRLALSHAPARPNEPTKTIQRPVAIKRVDPALTRDPYKVARFLDAARRAAELQHPNLSEVGEVVHDGEQVYVAMEFIVGESAASLVRRLHSQGERLKPVLAAHIIAEACAGLEAGHAAGLIHGHLTPHDIFISYNGSVHVLDVGIAHGRHELAHEQVDGVELEYAAPERCSGEGLDRRSDVFSLGTILWELLTGLSPFERAADVDVMRAIRDEPVVPPKNIVPGLPKEISDITLHALERDRGKRFQTAYSLREALLEPVRRLSNGFSTEAALATLMKRQFPERAADKRELVQRVMVDRPLDGLDFQALDRSTRGPRPLPAMPSAPPVSLPTSHARSTISTPARSNPPPGMPDQASIVIAPSADPPTPVGALIDATHVPLPPPLPLPQYDSGAPPRPPTNGRGATLGVAVALVVVLGVVGAIVASTRSSKADVKAVRPVLGTPSTVALPVAPPPAPIPAPPPTTEVAVAAAPSATAPVESSDTLLHIETVPSSAVVTIDGVKQGLSPLDVHVPKRSTPLTIELRHPGYATLRENVVPDMNQRLRLTLVANRKSSAPAPAAPPSAPTNPYKKFE